MAQQVLTFEVEHCPFAECGKSHSYKVQIRTVPTFGGKPSVKSVKQENVPVYKADLLVNCSTTGEDYQVTVEIPYARGQKVISVKAETND